MKITAAFTLIFAMLALVLTGMYILSTWDPNPNFSDVWRYVSFWPATLVDTFVKVFNNPAVFLKLGTFVYATLFTQIGATIMAIIMARGLDRSMVDWGVATFLFPYAAPFFLVFLKEH